MRRSRLVLVVAIASALGVLLLATALTERKSPGPVSSVHARLAEIEGGEACAACHGGWFGDMRSACSECHEDIAGQLREGNGLHGSLAPEVGGNCSLCHGEHHGAEFRLVNRLAFAEAGVADPQQFDHRRIGFAMSGKHLTLACNECHVNADIELLPSGGKRYLGLSRDCASCHADPHQGRMQFDCATCHDQEDFGTRNVPEHDRWLSLTGAHAEVQCRQCHAQNGPGALERLRPGVHEKARQCADCHATPHAASFLAGNARSAGVSQAAVCAICHPLDYMTFADGRVTITPEQHAHGGFPLTVPHDQIVCAACHTPNTTYAERHPGRQPRDCKACHADPHGGQFAAGPFAADGCVGCHAATHFAPHDFDLGHHARTRLPLDGRHAQLACPECHANPEEGTPRQFRGTPSRCEQCHDDAHQGAFAAVAERLAAAPRGTCAECHGTTAFAELDHQRFDHRDWTGFAIDGAHAQIECTDCHARTAAPDRFGRRFGRIPEHEGDSSCATCHGDPHEGAFAVATAPAEIDGRTGCRRCHDTASFRALPHGFDHGRFTGFALIGKHGEAACAACHEVLANPTATGRSWGKAKGRDCVACHQDPHLGQFERLGHTDCARCHKSTTTFASLSFRHNLDSRFALGEQHAKVPCASCHKPETIEGKTTVRYKPLPTECASCHGREEGGTSIKRRKS